MDPVSHTGKTGDIRRERLFPWPLAGTGFVRFMPPIAAPRPVRNAPGLPSVECALRIFGTVPNR